MVLRLLLMELRPHKPCQWFPGALRVWPKLLPRTMGLPRPSLSSCPYSPTPIMWHSPLHILVQAFSLCFLKMMCDFLSHNLYSCCPFCLKCLSCLSSQPSWVLLFFEAQFNDHFLKESLAPPTQVEVPLFPVLICPPLTPLIPNVTKSLIVWPGISQPLPTLSVLSSVFIEKATVVKFYRHFEKL